MKKQCQKLLLSNKLCKNNAVEDTEFCYRHGTQVSIPSLFKSAKQGFLKENSTETPATKKSARIATAKTQSHLSFTTSQTSITETSPSTLQNPKALVALNNSSVALGSSPDVSDIMQLLEKNKNKSNSSSSSSSSSSGSDSEIDERVLKLIAISKSMPGQRTKEWLDMRSNMLTASDIAACLVVTDYELSLHDECILCIPKSNRKLGKGCYAYKSIKMYLREKCEPEKRFGGNKFTFHGTKYEEVASQLYSFKNSETVHDFGLMRHPIYSFLGASPDGITSSGRMLEIKVPLSRELNGIPPIQYWVQMQMQMECCDLDVCDFVECKISEYNCEQEYLDDAFVDEEGNQIYGLTKNGTHKGCLLEIKYLDGENSKTVYKYAPISVTMKNHDEMTRWAISELSKLANDNDGNNFIELMLQEGCMSVERLWWKVDQYSQVEVKRDPVWFAKRFYDFEEFWSNVEKYRVEGIPESCLAKSRKGGKESDDDDPDEAEEQPIPKPQSNTFYQQSKTNSNPSITQNSMYKNQTTPFVTKAPLKKGAMGFCIVTDDDEDC